MNARRPCRAPLFRRIVRSDLARWLAVAVLTPLLMLSALGGTTFLAHGHDAHGLHVHAGHSVKEAQHSAARHLAAHDQGRCPMEPRHEHPADPHDHPPVDEPAPFDPDRPPAGVIVSVPDLDQIPTRPAELGAAISPVATLLLATFLTPAPPDAALATADPGGRGTPRNLLALRAGDRLVRTSRALLI